MFSLVPSDNASDDFFVVDGINNVLAVVSDHNEGEYLVEHLNAPSGSYAVVDISDGDVDDPLFSIQRDGEETIFIHENETALRRLLSYLNRKNI